MDVLPSPRQLPPPDPLGILAAHCHLFVLEQLSHTPPTPSWSGELMATTLPDSSWRLKVSLKCQASQEYRSESHYGEGCSPHHPAGPLLLLTSDYSFSQVIYIRETGRNTYWGCPSPLSIVCAPIRGWWGWAGIIHLNSKCLIFWKCNSQGTNCH